MKELNLNDVFQQENYEKYRAYATQNNYQIVEIDPIMKDNAVFRQFQIVANTPHIANYQELRRQEYPSIPEQLDMLYWDKVHGTNLWQQKITEIKEKYPKN